MMGFTAGRGNRNDSDLVNGDEVLHVNWLSEASTLQAPAASSYPATTLNKLPEQSSTRSFELMGWVPRPAVVASISLDDSCL